MFYSVYSGRTPGIYTTWSQCQEQVSKYPGAKFKKFSNQEEAKYFLEFGEEKNKNIKKKKLMSPTNVSKDYSPDVLYIYTDGSCPGNGKKGCRGGVGVHFKDSKHDDISYGCQDNPTNQKMELLAIQKALETILPYKEQYKKIELHTDSQYSIDCLTKYIVIWSKNNWRTSKNETVKNKEIIQEIQRLKIQFENLSFIHINSHTGKQDQHSLGNEQADRLAFLAASDRDINKILKSGE